MVSSDGAVWERGVEGRRELMLSSEVLLSWRTSVLASPMLAVSSGRLLSCCTGTWVVMEGDGEEDASPSTVSMESTGPDFGLRAVPVGRARSFEADMAFRR